MRFLCDLTNIFNNSTFVPVRVSLFSFLCSFHSCLIHYFSNNSFVLLTFFSHHLWVNKVKRRKSFVTFFFALSIPCFANSFVAVFHQRSFVLFLVPAFRPSTIQGFFFYYTTLLPPTKRSINNFLFGLFCVFTW